MSTPDTPPPDSPRILHLGDAARELDAASLAEHAGLAELHIRTESAFYTAANDDTLALIAASPAMSGLRVLELDRCFLRGPGVTALARSEHVQGLRELLLRVPPHAALCAALATSPAPALRPVERLALCADQLDAAGARSLTGAAELLEGLRSLELVAGDPSGADWGRPFGRADETERENTAQLQAALAVLIPCLIERGVTLQIQHTPSAETVRLDPAALQRLDLGSRTWILGVLPAAMAPDELDLDLEGDLDEFDPEDDEDEEDEFTPEGDDD